MSEQTRSYAAPAAIPVGDVRAGDLILLDPWQQAPDWCLVETELDANSGAPVITVLDAHNNRCSLLAVGHLQTRRLLNRK